VQSWSAIVQTAVYTRPTRGGALLKRDKPEGEYICGERRRHRVAAWRARRQRTFPPSTRIGGSGRAQPVPHRAHKCLWPLWCRVRQHGPSHLSSSPRILTWGRSGGHLIAESNADDTRSL